MKYRWPVYVCGSVGQRCRGYCSSRRAGSSTRMLLAVVLLGQVLQVTLAQNMLFPGIGQFAQNIGQGRGNLLSNMPSWGGLSMGQGIGPFSNPFQFATGGGLGGGLGGGPLFMGRQSNDPSLVDLQSSFMDPNYGQPFVGANQNQGQQLWPFTRQNADQQQKLRELQQALQGDPAVAAVVGPALLLASSILFTVSASLSTATTSIGIVGALVGNLVAWTRWINSAEIFFLGLRTGVGRRSLLEIPGNDTNGSPEQSAARAQLLTQLRAANDVMTNWGQQLHRARGNIQDSVFLDFLRGQASALETARKALEAVQAHPLGGALQLRTSALDDILHAGNGSGGAGGGGGGMLGNIFRGSIGGADGGNSSDDGSARNGWGALLRGVLDGSNGASDGGTSSSDSNALHAGGAGLRSGILRSSGGAPDGTHVGDASSLGALGAGGRVGAGGAALLGNILRESAGGAGGGTDGDSNDLDVGGGGLLSGILRNSGGGPEGGNLGNGDGLIPIAAGSGEAVDGGNVGDGSAANAGSGGGGGVLFSTLRGSGSGGDVTAPHVGSDSSRPGNSGVRLSGNFANNIRAGAEQAIQAANNRLNG